MTTKQVEACSKFRTKNRLPAMTYYHKQSGTSIWRSSQNKTGTFTSRSLDDEEMMI